MKKSTKAALLSALVFPGVGHIFIKKPVYGLLLIAASTLAVAYIFSQMMSIALQISDKILFGEVPVDAVAIAKLISQEVVTADSQFFNYAITVFVICWMIGVVDVYRLGEQINNKEIGK